MPNAIYKRAGQAFLEGEIVWSSDNIRALLIDTALYSVDIANDMYADAIPSGAIVGPPIGVPLASRTSTNGVADAANASFSEVAGESIEAVVIFKYTGDMSTSLLIVYLDTGFNLPVTPSGGGISLNWDSGANRIFRLV